MTKKKLKSLELPAGLSRLEQVKVLSAKIGDIVHNKTRGIHFRMGQIQVLSDSMEDILNPIKVVEGDPE